MSEYNPLNERFKKQYEEALIHGRYREASTVEAAWKAINLFERFTGREDFTSFNKRQAKDFKHWLVKQTNVKDEPLSLSTVRSTLSNLCDFFIWLSTHPHAVRKVDGSAVAYLRMSNNDERAGRATREAPVPSVEEARQALQNMTTSGDVEKRDRAIIAFTALTGVRDAALITLKLKDIDLQKREIWQDPKHVKTKNRKGITTFFMAFDPLWEAIVKDWINHLTGTLGFTAKDPIFPKEDIRNDPATLSFKSFGLSRDHWANATPVRDIFKRAFVAAGLPYYRPHSFRKMLVLWALEHCSQAQFKAISQNIGHEHAMTTYNSYGTLSKTDQRKLIEGIGHATQEELGHISTAHLLDEIKRRSTG